jgi:hypothetical protein
LLETWRAVLPSSLESPYNPPVIAPIGDHIIVEGESVTFTATATDADAGETVRFSLLYAPQGATIDPVTGAFSWTPTPAQSPGAYTFYIIAKDNGPAAMTDAMKVTVQVLEQSVRPELEPIGPFTVDEETPLTFTAIATDADAGQTLTFTLDNAPAGAWIDPSTGAFSWTPTESDGGQTFTFDVIVTDSGTPALSDFETVTVTVRDVNAPPNLLSIGNFSVTEGNLVTIFPIVQDHDVPVNELTFSLVNAPAGSGIDPATGRFSWIPTEEQGPGAYTFQIVVTDNGTPARSDSETVTITVREDNFSPVLNFIPNAFVNELSLVTFTAVANDPNPGQTITYALVNAPTGASIDPVTGVFGWTPDETQGYPGASYTLDVTATDNGSPMFADSQSVTIFVNEVNSQPVLAPVGDKTVQQGQQLQFTVSASDADVPANTLTYQLGFTGLPATIDPTTGLFTLDVAPDAFTTTYLFDVFVLDNVGGSDLETFQVTVTAGNAAPALAPIGNKNAVEGQVLTFTASATDPDVGDIVTYSLVNAPAGATINSTSGVFTWTPTAAQAPGSYTFDVVASDNGSPIRSDNETITVSVATVNVNAPILNPIGNKTTNEAQSLIFTASASDPDAGQTLTYSLVGAPSGATINATSGVFAWIPTEAQGPGNYSFSVRVTDNGTPALSASETITVTVNEVNSTPLLSNIPNQSVVEQQFLTFTAVASDSDVPANTLQFSLINAPSGAQINPNSGVFTWTPAAGQAGTYNLTVVVTDNGTPALNASQSVQIIVTPIGGNTAPVLNFIANQTVTFGQTVQFTASATDAQVPPQSLTFSLENGSGLVPAGATINASTGAFTWTPTAAGTVTFDVVVRDNGTPALEDRQTIQITVNPAAGNQPPILLSPADGQTYSGFTAGAPVNIPLFRANDPNFPNETLTWTLTSPAGVTGVQLIQLDPVSRRFSWTPAIAGTFRFVVTVTDSAGNSDSSEFFIVVS